MVYKKERWPILTNEPPEIQAETKRGHIWNRTINLRLMRPLL